MRVAVVGSGAIGASWAALFAATGHDVAASDPDPKVLDALPTTVQPFWESLERLGVVVAGASPDRIEPMPSAEAAVEGCDFVQENGPERLDVKHEIYALLDAVARPEVVLASSSSGIMPSDIQSACTRHPERVVIGHPFNPPHLVPLVEVVGGAQTSTTTIEAAMDTYRSVGKAPIHIRSELPGHVTNRLQAALWREAYWLVEQGVVTVAEIDAAISNGPGLRWALLGPFATQHFSGGPGGMAHVMEHLGPPMAAWWDTMQTPMWGPELVSKVVQGVDDELGGLDPTAVQAKRDRLLEELLVAKAGAEPVPGVPPERSDEEHT